MLCNIISSSKNKIGSTFAEKIIYFQFSKGFTGQFSNNTFLFLLLKE